MLSHSVRLRPTSTSTAIRSLLTLSYNPLASSTTRNPEMNSVGRRLTSGLIQAWSSGEGHVQGVHGKALQVVARPFSSGRVWSTGRTQSPGSGSGTTTTSSTTTTTTTTPSRATRTLQEKLETAAHERKVQRKVQQEKRDILTREQSRIVADSSRVKPVGTGKVSSEPSSQDEILRFFLDQESRARRMRHGTAMRREAYVKIWGLTLTGMTVAVLFITNHVFDFTPIEEPQSQKWSTDENGVLQVDEEYLRSIRG